jgi:phage gp29-like protein
MAGRKGTAAQEGVPAGYPKEGDGTYAQELARRVQDPAKDPAFAAPIDVTGDVAKARASVVYKDLPIVTIQNTWTVEQARGALYAHMAGMFDASGQLLDAVLGDDRVTATLNSRATALFGREVIHKPANDSKAAREVCDAWADHYPQFVAKDGGLRCLQDTQILMGTAPAQIVWDTTPPIWKPYARQWHQRFTYYDWTLRRFVALCEGESQVINPGNGKWMLHAPFGAYRGWVRGALRAVVEPWMLRHFGFRDMARFAEVHGMPTRVGVVPAAAAKEERSDFETKLQMIGANTAMILPTGVDDENKYDYKLVEAIDTAWQVFPGQIDRCDMAIVLAILMVNLTTEVTGGSFAATKSHMDVRAGGTQYDNAAWMQTLQQVTRPFAAFNYGDADLAPVTCYDVTPREEYTANAAQFQALGTGLQAMASAGVRFTKPRQLRRFIQSRLGLTKFPTFTIEPPAPKAAAPALTQGKGNDDQA